MWNHYDINGPRTLNHVECYKLNKLLSKPNIWRFIAKIFNEEVDALIKYKRLANYNKSLEENLKIEKAKNKLLNKEMDDLNDNLNL